MPGTTRYSATFDRTYEEEAKPSSPPNARRSRSQSWQANSGHDGRQYTPFASRSPAQRSSSTDNSPSKGIEFIPTRTAKTSVKAHNNPFQFVKVGTCPLYKKAEEQLKKAKEIKKPDVLKEEEEEWQSNLDSWKSRRRKMSEDVFRRQEEIKLLELEEQIAQVSQKKTKTFSEMVESRATRGRALSLCLLTSPLEFQAWEFENKAHKNGSCSYTDESGDNSIVNSEDEGVSVRGRNGESSHNESEMNHRTNGNAHIEQNGSQIDTQNGNCNKLSSKPKENAYIDSGLESISSSHRAGDTPDSGSDFSQDSNSSIDCDSPRTGVNVLEEFSSKPSQVSKGHEISINLNLEEKGQDFGFTFLGGKDEGQVIIASILEGSKAESSGVQLGDRLVTIDGCDLNSKKHIEIAALIQKGREKGRINLLLWRNAKTTQSANGSHVKEAHKAMTVDENLNAKSYEKSIESENEMYVDDFEELKRQSELLANKKSNTDCTNKGVYAFNVDSNQILQEGISANSLIPLSPVTELPSPADETKSLSSTLSSSKVFSDCKSQNAISNNDVEIKPSIPIAQDNNTTISTSPKIENSKSPVRHTNLKNVEKETQLGTESKPETINASSLGPKINGFQDEKSKTPSVPKKVKSNKLKKGTVPEKSSAVSENAKTQISGASSKTLVQQKSSSDLKSSVENQVSDIKNDVENLTISKAVENNIITEHILVAPVTKIETTPSKKLVSNCAVSNGAGIQSPKVQTSLEAPKASEDSKICTFEDNTPKKNSQKKVVAKHKVNTTENSCTLTDANLNQIYSTKQQSPPSVEEKYENMGSKNETTMSILKQENNIPLNGIANVSQDIKLSPEKDETSIPCPSTNKVKDLALKFGEKKSSATSESQFATKNGKNQKTPLNGKSEPVIIVKKESAKAKGISDEQVPISNKQVENKSLASSISNSSESSSSKNLSKSTPLKKEKVTTSDLQDVVQAKTVTKNETKVSPLTRVINFYKSYK